MPPVTLSPIAQDVPNPIGIDYHEPTGGLIISVNYPTGLPVNFELLDQAGTRRPFSSVSGFPNEVKVATVRSGPHTGGFTVGEVFTGNGKPGEIVRISSDGQVVQDPWVTLNDPGLLRGGLFQDRFGVFDGDLIVATTSGGVWRVTATGSTSRLANLGVHLEGVTTVPTLGEYGPWAGTVVVGADEQNEIHAIGADGSASTFRLGINTEDIEVIPIGEAFFGIDHTGRAVQHAAAEQFVGMAGGFLFAQELSGVLSYVRWDPTASRFQIEQVAQVGQWEHVTFAPPDRTARAAGTPTDSVFGFVALRPPDRIDPRRALAGYARYSDDGTRSPLHQRVAALTGDDRRGEAVELAIEHMADASYAGATVHPVVDAAAQASRATTAAEARSAASTALGVDSLEEYLNGGEGTTARNGLWDGLYAQTLVPNARPDDRNRLNDGARALNYLTRLAELDGGEPPEPAAALTTARLVVPAGVVPQVSTAASELEPDDVVLAEIIDRLKELHRRVTATSAAIRELKDVDREYRSERVRLFPEASLDLMASDRTQTPIVREELETPVLRVPPAFVVISPGVADEPSAPEPAPDPASRTVTVPATRSWTSTEEGRNRLSTDTRELLDAAGATFAQREPVEIAAALADEISSQTVAFLSTLPARAIPAVAGRAELRQIADLVAVPLAPLIPVAPDPFPQPGSPAARGIRPLGVGDLLVVQQQLVRYAPGEVAHIENVLRSEHKTRTHTRVSETEETVVVETEEQKETERDLQSTERFELQKETEQTIESELDIEAGLSVTASYGFVSATATADFAFNQSRSESNKVASKFAKETVDRSVTRIMQRTREERTRRTLERITEVNEHGLDNSNGSGNITGVYRWVDKFYRARMVNYGRRLMMEFIIPEPAAFYIHAQSSAPPPGVTEPKPVEPRVWGLPLRPNHLNAVNVHDFIAQYNVTDIAPFPSPTTKVGAAVAEAPSQGDAKNVNFAKADTTLVVPAGYRATDVYGQIYYQGYDNKYFLSCFVAGETFGSVSAYGLEGVVPVSVTGYISAFHLNLVATCELLPATVNAWQLDAYESIMTAYQRALSEYNEQIAAAEVQTGVQIAGRNPEINRGIEAAELKKGALRMLTDEYARTRVGGALRTDELFDAMRPGGTFGYPEFDVDEALIEGKIIQFFEQAFEWNNMTYRFYPYFWGRKQNWKSTTLLDDSDPRFGDFLRAGAARVVVPVPLAYTEAVLHYLSTNEIWNGDQPPTLDDPLFISIVDEIRADTEADIAADLPSADDGPEYPCVVSEWDVKVPTSLIYLQPDAGLPDLRAAGTTP